MPMTAHENAHPLLQARDASMFNRFMFHVGLVRALRMI